MLFFHQRCKFHVLTYHMKFLLLLLLFLFFHFQVHNQSTENLQRCQCTHLTWFGGDIFIPPNSLNIKASIAKLPEIYKHPALLATFCVIIGLYILGLLWARRKDRKDIAKVFLQSLKLILLNGTLGIQLDLQPDSIVTKFARTIGFTFGNN